MSRIQAYSAFDIIGPAMVGPSSSHTAGAARLGGVANKIAGGDILKAKFTLYGSFAKTAQGHGTDRALLAGVMGIKPDDGRLRDAFSLAKESGLEYEFILSPEKRKHANTAAIQIETSQGEIHELVGASLGGGGIMITELDGLELELTGEYPTLVVSYQDEPGVISRVSGILARHGINIAFMQVFRHAKGEDAFMVMECDENIPPEAGNKITGLDGINNIFNLSSNIA